MLKAENGSSEDVVERDPRTIESKEYSYGDKGSRSVRFSDEEAKTLLAKREEMLKKKHGKNYKMPLTEALKTGVFALK